MVRQINLRALRGRLALELVSIACRLPRSEFGRPLRVMGLDFPSPLGIAAGFDRSGRLARRVAALGFGFNEIGSLTAQGLARLQLAPHGEAQLGINLTLDARNSTAESCTLLRAARAYGDYLVLNLMGPASAPLLQQPTRLRLLLAALRADQHELNQAGSRQIPLVVKLRCLPGRVPFSITEMLLELGFDGLLAAHDPGPPATRERYQDWQHGLQQAQACEQIAHLRRFCGEGLALISVGGIQAADQLQARMAAGAQLVQVHSALLHQGPWLAHRLLR
ncbi:phosphoserine aminotransferase [Stutzerimonas stutzeri]|uniref:Phosphoserine aminotransferase n=1 Tax=Stutzerimonas stutzeri TaxID=316 RepID=A0A2S4ATI3_STUST|nr:phosphoserine aminotransferase [Stutzerimonas stutzeri]MCQ4261488.1 phosphoserine aminotransferase [Stutzerimonas stutzeri]POH84791.1 phosphoserine aminotransferase [Stutzerimonas stutzeri]